MRAFVPLFIYVAGLGFFLTTECYAQAIRVAGGNQTLTIVTGVPGGQPISASNTSCRLRYRRQSATSKITVTTYCPGQRYNLDVMAINVTQGIAAPRVSLANGSPPMDLITNIPSSGFRRATCTLQFIASATFGQGNSAELGDDVHTVTYTIQTQ